MKKIITKKNILIGFIALFILIQFFRIDKSTLPVNPKTDFISTLQCSDDVSGVLKKACYDCHSNQAQYPWYTNIAPVSWWIKHHINEGSHHLNFSIWETYTAKRKDHKLEECIEMIEEDEMPMKSYTWMHKEAKLTLDEKQLLINWFKAEKLKLNYIKE